MSTIEEEKRRLRGEVLALRNKLTTGQRVVRSADILQKLFELEAVRRAGWIHFYVSYGSEVETTGMIAHALSGGKHVTVPKMDPASRRLVLSELKDPVRELSPGPIGIPEPVSGAFRPVGFERMDLFVVPGIAFDPRGNRLGQGAGYYDRLLTPVAERVPIIGLAFELQLVEALPTDDHDVRMNWVITEKRTMDCRKA
ncbi:MAG TPA: 5-formyltetrahydrofolate cyclo-ligase [Nitrospiria bacterium]|nr:5-formyltetrahydrofolate cyclo-ligase [Nitrospiria bacterium]HUK55614.1 5-formyltetrahydrofolate cyclo-ligase [Nitrospiria bacterium]